MNLKKIDNIIFFGGTINVLEILIYLKKTNYIFYFFSSKRMINEKINNKGSLGDNLKLNKINYFLEEDINKSKKLIKLIKKNSLGIGIAEPWKFSKKIIEKFNYNLIDYMGIPLPRYRGGAHFTWMILQNEKKNGACFQIINENSEQGVYDSGDKIEYLNYKNKPNSLPIDYFLQESKIALKIFKKLIYKIEKNIKIKFEPINEKKSLFLPRLNTLKNGWIDWQNWKSNEIVDFINAFSFPYIGASTYLNKNRIYLQKACLHKTQYFHPFLSGLITRIENNNLYIISKTGIIIIEQYNFEKKIFTNPKLGERFFTPLKKLEEALTFSPNYTSAGLDKS
jgi:methionyl-tRNA formyltransferase